MPAIAISSASGWTSARPTSEHKRVPRALRPGEHVLKVAQGIGTERGEVRPGVGAFISGIGAGNCAVLAQLWTLTGLIVIGV